MQRYVLFPKITNLFTINNIIQFENCIQKRRYSRYHDFFFTLFATHTTFHWFRAITVTNCMFSTYTTNKSFLHSRYFQMNLTLIFLNVLTLVPVILCIFLNDKPLFNSDISLLYSSL